MNWMDFDRNGVVDGRDFFILDQIIDPPEERDEYDPFSDEGYSEGDDMDSW